VQESWFDTGNLCITTLCRVQGRAVEAIDGACSR